MRIKDDKASILLVSAKATNLLPANKKVIQKRKVFEWPFTIVYKKTVRSFVAEIYRSVNGAGDSCKATSWHIQTSA